MKVVEWLKSAVRWVKSKWPLVAWAGLIVVLVLGYRLVRSRASVVSGTIAKPVRWMPAPNSDTRVVVANPETGKPEVVDLPDGVRVRQVESVGISSGGEAYEVKALHDATDRRGGSGDPSGDLGL